MRKNESNPNSISNDNIYQIIKPSDPVDQVLWIGTRFGLNKLNLRTEQFTSYIDDASEVDKYSKNVIDGNIIFEDTNGENIAKTSDGNIVFENLRGALTAQTSDGDIRGDLIHLTNKLYLKTSDGNISVTVPDGLGMNVRLKGEGIYTKLDDFSGDTSDHLVEGTIRGGGIEVELITSDGNINLDYK